jgi:hypothetical protein
MVSRAPHSEFLRNLPSCIEARIAGSHLGEKLPSSALCASSHAVPWLAVYSVLIWMPSLFLWSRRLTLS